MTRYLLSGRYTLEFSLMKDKFIIGITNDFGGAPGLPGGGAPDHFGMPGAGAPGAPAPPILRLCKGVENSFLLPQSIGDGGRIGNQAVGEDNIW